MSLFDADKKIIIIGDRDGIPGPAIEECIKTTDAEVVFFLLLSVLSERLQEPWIWKIKEG